MNGRLITGDVSLQAYNMPILIKTPLLHSIYPNPLNSPSHQSTHPLTRHPPTHTPYLTHPTHPATNPPTHPSPTHAPTSTLITHPVHRFYLLNWPAAMHLGGIPFQMPVVLHLSTLAPLSIYPSWHWYSTLATKQYRKCSTENTVQRIQYKNIAIRSLSLANVINLGTHGRQ